MFEVKDKNGVRINIKDEVAYTVTQTGMFNDGESKDVSGVVIALLNEELVQVQPEDGTADEVPCNSLVVIHSLINDVEGLTDTESMQKLIYDAEKRYKDECDKAGTTPKTRKAPTKKKAQGTMKL